MTQLSKRLILTLFLSVAINGMALTGHLFAISPFLPGERFTYKITVMGVPAGEATLEVNAKAMMNGQEVYPLVSTAQSNDLTSLFYPVDDRVESYMDAKNFYSHCIRIQQHRGKKSRDKRVLFDQTTHKAIRLKKGQEAVFDIPAHIQDSLSAIYFYRTFAPVSMGASNFIDIHESDKNWSLELQTLAKERVTTPVGSFDAIKVKAVVHFDGPFLEKGDVFIWFTDDLARAPVMVQSKMTIGRITALLSSRRNGVVPDADAASPPIQQSCSE